MFELSGFTHDETDRTRSELHGTGYGLKMAPPSTRDRAPHSSMIRVDHVGWFKVPPFSVFPRAIRVITVLAAQSHICKRIQELPPSSNTEPFLRPQDPVSNEHAAARHAVPFEVSPVLQSGIAMGSVGSRERLSARGGRSCCRCKCAKVPSCPEVSPAH